MPQCCKGLNYGRVKNRLLRLFIKRMLKQNFAGIVHNGLILAAGDAQQKKLAHLRQLV
jgi:hypothetical protein